MSETVAETPSSTTETATTPATNSEKVKKGKGKKEQNDIFRFQGKGVSFKAKIIGIEDVPEARGDQICQETILRLKGAVKASGEHKQRIALNVSLEGIKLIDEKTQAINHTHPVHRISFISRDTTDARAFGYIFGPGDGTHKFFGIKTQNNSEAVVLTLRDLFQTVFEMKKKEMELAQQKQDETQQGTQQTSEEHYQVPKGAPVPVANGQAVQNGQAATGGATYAVPTNNTPVEQPTENGVGNLLDLQTEMESLQQRIAQMDMFTQPWPGDTSATPAAAANPWGQPAANTNAFPTNFQTNPTMNSQPSANSGFNATFPQSAINTNPQFPAQQPSAFPRQADPFNDPFFKSGAAGQVQGGAFPATNMAAQQPAVNAFGATMTTSPGFNAFGNATPAYQQPGIFNQTNAFGGPAQPNQPPPTVFSPTNTAPGSVPKVHNDPFKNDPFFNANSQAPLPTTVPASQPANNEPADKFAVFSELSSVFDTPPATNTPTQGPMDAFVGDNPLVPLQIQKEEQTQNEKAASTDLFSDLNPLGTSKPFVAKHELFKETKNPPKKSLNQMMQKEEPQQPTDNVAVSDPFNIGVTPAAPQNPPAPAPRNAPAPIQPSGGPAEAPLFDDNFGLPSPNQPPPPLPEQGQFSFPDEGPAPPPRPRPSGSNQPGSSLLPGPPVPKPRQSVKQTPNGGALGNDPFAAFEQKFPEDPFSSNPTNANSADPFGAGSFGQTEEPLYAVVNKPKKT